MEEFAKCFKKLISPFTEETVGILVDIIFNSNPVSNFKELKRKPSPKSVVRPENILRDFLLSKVDIENVLCIRHIPELTALKRAEVWMFTRELFCAPMHAAIARANLNLFLIEEKLEESIEESTSSNSHVYDDGYADV